MSVDVYQIVTDRILAMLEAGTVPWRKPWKGGARAWPTNHASRKEYRGINVFLLGMASAQYRTSEFLTFKQALDRKSPVRKGEKGYPVIFWNWIEKKTAEGKADRIPVLRYYTVFNVDQCDGLAPHKLPTDVVLAPHERIAACETIVRAMPDAPAIREGGSRACYSPDTDRVSVPAIGAFTTPEEYYSTLFHELSHATGHKKRLGRDMSAVTFGDHAYSKEELVAEFSAAMLSGVAGISPVTLDNSAAYIAHWSQRLRDDRKLVVQAAGAAQKAADWILGRKAPGEENAPEETPAAAPVASLRSA